MIQLCVSSGPQLYVRVWTLPLWFLSQRMFIQRSRTHTHRWDKVTSEIVFFQLEKVWKVRRAVLWGRAGGGRGGAVPGAAERGQQCLRSAGLRSRTFPPCCARALEWSAWSIRHLCARLNLLPFQSFMMSF